MPGSRVNLKVRLGRLVLQNPLMAASGTFGWGEAFERIRGFDNDILGAVVLKGTTLHARPGNPPPRIVETAGGAGLLNSIGLENPGVEVVIKEHLPALKNCKARVIANVAGGTVEEYAAVTAAFDTARRIDAMEINISCPNVKAGGAQFGASAVATRKVVSACRAATSKPIIAKLSPNVTDIRPIAQAAVEAGADAISLINTLRGMAVDVETGRPVLGNNIGGLSGPAIKPIGLLKVHEVYTALGGAVPLIASGGIFTGRDAAEYIIAGASAFQVGTVLFRDPGACGRILDELRELLPRLGEDDVNDLIGTLELNPPDAWARNRR